MVKAWGLTLLLKNDPKLIEEYKEYHRHCWPEVSDRKWWEKKLACSYTSPSFQGTAILKSRGSVGDEDILAQDPHVYVRIVF